MKTYYEIDERTGIVTDVVRKPEASEHDTLKARVAELEAAIRLAIDEATLLNGRADRCAAILRAALRGMK